MLKKILAFAMLCGVTFSAYAKLEFALECHHDSGKAPGTEYFYSFGTTAEIFDINGNQKLSEWGNLKLTSTSIENYEYSQYSTYPKPQLTAIANWKKTYTLNRASLNLLRNIDFRSNE